MHLSTMLSSLDNLRKPYVQDMVYSRLNITIVPIHVPQERLLLGIADRGSKFIDTDNWGIDEYTFKVIQTVAAKAVICNTFAYDMNKNHMWFYSKIPLQGC